MRRFLSRVSLNSSYTHEDDDKSSILSGPLSPTASVMSRDSKRKVSGGKKGSWWKKSKKEDKTQNLPRLPPVAAPAHTESSPSSSPTNLTRTKTVQSIAPPPRLPDDLFDSGFSSLDSDMFKNFK
ncbi:hypothetical protein DFP73DRAFT_469547 [Morchella snyderi]|uniref:Uncharacterized protein n=1 Tax=Morchella conica CCBAS932 TaxID=1392247 RepID=A0A3N4L291_9PEZI|nr:hypothetical protein DFP73DRAFT_469547 [Morchella snyderi]RPB16940.1 hypothetical protein P167DRAFT_499586 [Morchella conica CCBAS932]